MAEKICKYEKEIGKHFEMVHRHEHILEDNSKPGLVSTVIELKHSIDNLITIVERKEEVDEEIKKDIELTKKAFITLQKWQMEHDLNREKKEKESKEKEEEEERKAKDKADIKIRKQNLTLYAIFVVFTVINIVANLFLK